jgi:hypothetical protein
MAKPFRSKCGYCGAHRDTRQKMYDHLMFRHQERFEADVHAAQLRKQIEEEQQQFIQRVLTTSEYEGPWSFDD